MVTSDHPKLAETLFQQSNRPKCIGFRQPRDWSAGIVDRQTLLGCILHVAKLASLLMALCLRDAGGIGKVESALVV